jgi:hypothetical protein
MKGLIGYFRNKTYLRRIMKQIGISRTVSYRQSLLLVLNHTVCGFLGLPIMTMGYLSDDGLPLVTMGYP